MALVRRSCAVAAATIALQSDRGAAEGPAVYSEEEARKYFNYARVAFCSPENVENWECGTLCQVAPISEGSLRVLGKGTAYQVQGFVAAMPTAGSEAQRCVVAFRGSVNDANWLADGELWKMKWPSWQSSNISAACPGCNVHHGFGAAFLSVRQELHSAVAGLGCRRTAMVGHSLGAALATLAVMYLRSDVGVVVDPVYLYGSPRVGNAAFAYAFEAAAVAQGARPSAWRVIHYHDPVPRGPPTMLEYHHVGAEVYYYSELSDAYKVCENAEDRACSHAMAWGDADMEDHTLYMNQTTIHTDLPQDCTGLAREGRHSTLHSTAHRAAAHAKKLAHTLYHLASLKFR